MLLKYMLKKYNDIKYNCWDFVRDFYKQEFNIELPNFNVKGTGQYKLKYEIYKQESKNWKKLKKPKMYCVVVLSDVGKADHVGIYLGKGNFIHNTKQANVSISNLNKPEWLNNVVGFYEHEKIHY